jgi:hypothetical protein
LEVGASNNNVDIEYFESRLYMGFRTSENHFASKDTRMVVMASADDGVSWELELEISMETDLREPRLLSFLGQLQFIFFEGGSNPLKFEPQKIWRSFRASDGAWSDPEIMIDAPEVPWDIKVRGGIAYMTSYAGGHYRDEPKIEVYFRQTLDGLTWTKVDEAPYVYVGGASEATFEFDSDGSLWAVTRNEDGDQTGKGSHVCWAPAEALSAWECSKESDPERYDSPEMFRHGDDIYLVARRDIGGPYGADASMLAYSTRPKTTALYSINKESRAVEHIMDLPGAGDNAFPAIHRTGTHSFQLANYTSPLDEPDISWLEGQLSEKGTSIYLLDLVFESVLD